MRIGTMFLGKVDDLDNESIQTKFFVLGVPLVPMSSHYVVGEEVSGIRGFEIPLHGKSVALGYLRLFAWLGALLTGIFAFVDHHNQALLVPSIGLGAFAFYVTFFFGGLSKNEKARRSLLKEITGVGAPPEFLPADMVVETSERLRSVWSDHNPGKEWTQVAETSEPDPVLFAIAEFERRPDLAARMLARLAS